MFYRKKRPDDPLLPQAPPMSNAESLGAMDTSLLTPPSRDPNPMDNAQVQVADASSERLSTLPLPSMPWVQGDDIDERRPGLAAAATLNVKALPSTPPLSPSSSMTETLVRNNSNGSGSSSSGGVISAIATTTGLKMDIHDIASGPPIIPRSKTPPPLMPLVESELQQRKEKMATASKTIFDSDDDDEYDEDADESAGLFFQDFSPDAPRLSTVLKKKKRASKKAAASSSKKATVRMSKFDLMAFANHLHDNRLSVMQLRESRISLTEEDEHELIKLLEKRKSMASVGGGLPLEDDGEAVPAVPPLPVDTDSAQQPRQPSVVIVEPSVSDHEADECKHSSAEAVPPATDVPSQRTPSLLSEEAVRRRRVRKSMSMDEIHRMQQAQQQEKTLVEMEPIQEVEPTSSSDNTVAPANMVLKPSTSTPSIKSRSNNSESAKPSTRSRAIGLFGSLRQASRATPLRGLVRNLSNASRLSRQASFTRGSTATSSFTLGKHGSKATLATPGGGDSDGMSPAARAVMEHNDKQRKKEHKNDDKDARTDTAPQHQQQHHHQEPPKKSRLLTHLLAKAGKARRTKTVNMASSADKRRDKTKSKIVRRTIIYVPPDSLNFLKNLEKGDSNKVSSPSAPPLPADMAAKIQQYNADDKPDEKKEGAGVGGSSGSAVESELESVLNYYDDDSLYDYYRTRESSVPQLEGLELREMDDGTVEWGIVKKQGNRKSFFAHGIGASSGTSEEHKHSAAAGVAQALEHEDDEEDEEQIEEQVLRLMGLPIPASSSSSSLAKPQHPASSSVAYELSSSSNSSSPPPVPRRSPRRRIDSNYQQQQHQHQHDEHIDHRRAKHISTIRSRKDASTTDVYFAPQQTLPSLLQLIADTSADEQEKKHASVEEQLDEVMRSFQQQSSTVSAH